MDRRQEIIWQPRYSETDEPDKRGRWSRKAMWNSLHIAWISMVQSGDEVRFSLATHFPVNGNDMPNHIEVFKTFEQAKDRAELLWNSHLETYAKERVIKEFEKLEENLFLIIGLSEFPEMKITKYIEERINQLKQQP